MVRMQSRHKGIPLPQLVAEDPGWCRFVLDQAEAKCKEFTEVAVWLRENAPELRDVSSDSWQVSNTVSQVCGSLNSTVSQLAVEGGAAVKLVSK